MIFDLKITLTLKDLRKARRMTLQEMSEKTGLSLTVIVKTEKGTAYPKRVNRQKIAEALGIDETNFDLLWEAGRIKA